MAELSYSLSPNTINQTDARITYHSLTPSNSFTTPLTLNPSHLSSVILNLQYFLLIYPIILSFQFLSSFLPSFLASFLPPSFSFLLYSSISFILSSFFTILISPFHPYLIKTLHISEYHIGHVSSNTESHLQVLRAYLSPGDGQRDTETDA